MAPVCSSIEVGSLPFRELHSVHAKARLSRSPLRLTLDGPDLGQTDEVLDVLVPFPFSLFLGREAPGAVLRDQFLDAVLQVRGGSQAEDFFRRWQTSQRLQDIAPASIAR
jgi:hypothetical protein